MENANVIYISGYGRSGSTLLDIILGSHPSIMGTGELANLFELYYNAGSYCSCGKTYNECEVWSEIINKAYPNCSKEQIKSNRDVQRKIEKWINMPFFRILRSKVKTEQQYCRVMKPLFNAIYDVGKIKCIVDSSKSAYDFSWRALYLSKLCGINIRLIHLIRDGRAVISSRIKGSNKKLRDRLNNNDPLAAYKGLIGWISANSFTIINRILIPRNSYLLIRYEDFIEDPQKELVKLGKFLQLDFNDTIKAIKNGRAFDVHHLVEGNRLARQNKVKLNASSQGYRNLPKHVEVLYFIFGWPIIFYSILSSRSD